MSTFLKSICVWLGTCLLWFLPATDAFAGTTPIRELLERIDKGASSKFILESVKSERDFFELDQRGKRVVIRGNNPVSIAAGLNWYLKYYAGVHLSWNGMQAQLPEILPPVTKPERRETALPYRYYLNYCTFSYSMAFWDWKRWEQEIDWMALHGINLSLAITGAETVWYNVLERLGYSQGEINEFISGPGFFAWWLMNNLEGWGGANPDSWYLQQANLQKKILARMREYGIEPVLPGYCGMVPHNAKKRLGLNVSNPGMWCGYQRPAFLQPEETRFEEISTVYYQEMEKLYGKANYYALDPFHEGGSTEGVDLAAAGTAILKAMKRANPHAVWVAQAWQKSPQPEMMDAIPQNDMLVLDLFSESRPQWGDPESSWYRKGGFGGKDWVYCMLLNYGANVGLHGKMDHVINGFYQAQADTSGAKSTLKGVGLTMEGIENNPVMYELAMELPWRSERFSKEEWLPEYLKARYGTADSIVLKAWEKLGRSIYNCPKSSTQQGTHESVFCARPQLDVYQASCYSEMSNYYAPQEVIEAARLLLSVAENYRGNNHFEYDLIDVVRQAVAEKGRLTLKAVDAAYRSGYSDLFEAASRRFLELILLQDKLLGTRTEFRVGRWLEGARALGNTSQEKALYEWNARVQITTWGHRVAADDGGLRDYAHKEWNGILKDYYYLRWKTFFTYLGNRLNGKEAPRLDMYALEEPWSRGENRYSATPEGESVEVAQEVFRAVFLP